MENKRPVGVIVFGILIILGVLYQLLGAIDFNKCKILFQPLPEKIILVHYSIVMGLLIMALISGIGIFFLKNIFRKIILITAIFNLYSYIVELPLLYFPNTIKFIKQTSIEIALKNPGAPAEINSLVLWVFTIVSWVIDFSFAICLVYYFTRPKVKAQFK